MYFDMNSKPVEVESSGGEKCRVIRFPSIDINCSPRVINSRINNSNIPLMKYRQVVSATNRGDSFESDYVEKGLLRKINENDGLIFQIKNMRQSIERNIGSYGQRNHNSTRQDLNNGGQNVSLLREAFNIKILVCVCMYNQSKNAINLTLNGIYRNLPNLKKEGISNGDIAVVLLQDGILKLVQDKKKRTFAKGENSMVYFYEKMDQQEGKNSCALIQRIHTILDETENYERQNMLGNVQRNKEIPPSIQKNISLLYQNLWKPSKTKFNDQNQQQTAPDTEDQLRIFSCFKHTNGTKLSSHLWFFQGFCRYLKPEYCVLLDVGTVPDQKGISNLIKGLSQDKNYGGATGFMTVDSNFPSEQGGDDVGEDGCFMKCFASIEKAQQYEYIISHFLDKNCESALGFLHVLPGAWSAYRYQALIKSQKFQQNLLERSYFKMILNPNLEERDFREANMYLAEDRILSLGIYAQGDAKFTLKYVPNAIAKTDPMKDHENLMNQRRRWINSSLFAFLYVFKNYYFHVVESKHNQFRKFVTLNISMWLALLSMLNSYIAPSIYLFVLFSTIYQLGFKGSNVVATIVTLIYVLIFMAGVAGALTGRQWSKRAGLLSAVFSFFTFLMFALVVYNVLFIYLQLTNNPIAQNENGSSTFDSKNLSGKPLLILVMAALNIGLFILLMIAHLFTHPGYVLKLFLNTLSYMSYTGAYAQTMVIHGFCNVDDVSWGTKGSAGQGGKKYQSQKVFFVSSWLLTNSVLAFIFIYVDIISLENGNNKTGGIVLIIIAVYGTIIICIKTLLALGYHFVQMCRQCCYKPISSEERMKAVDEYWHEFLEKKWKNPQPHELGISRIQKNSRRK